MWWELPLLVSMYIGIACLIVWVSNKVSYGEDD